LAQRAVCIAANTRALEIMDGLEAVTVIQDVRTAALVAFAASRSLPINFALSATFFASFFVWSRTSSALSAAFSRPS